MSGPFVPIAFFLDRHTAHLLRARLEVEKIPVFLQKDPTARSLLYAPLVHRPTLLLVPRDKVDKATQLLKELEPDESWRLTGAKPSKSKVPILAILLFFAFLIWRMRFVFHLPF
jgi:hypothetical protein